MPAPNAFWNRKTTPLFPFALFGGLSFACCQYLIYCYAPTEAVMGLMQKIFYLHLPLAWWALFSFFVVFLGSVLCLFKRAPRADSLCAAAAEVGVLLSGLALLTGMVWARKSWGVWWTWDPRLTTTLIMWFVYAGYLVLRGLDLPEGRKTRMCAVVGVVAFLDVPLVFISARIWRSIHPAVFTSKEGGLEPEMKLTVMACLLCFGFLWAAVVWLRKRQIDSLAALDRLARTGATAFDATKE
ncbi:MAG: cytochrome c biogenesis protein [Desulfovibrio sp.]|jgi:heme exporter protein C|nr:cytochrome c biogenesis protein [Desulfovibrio sp.]